jgi:hypothetical protein
VTEGHVFDAESVDAEREMSPSTSSPPAPPCSHRCRGHLNLANKPKAIELWTLLDIALTAGNVCTKLMKPSGGGTNNTTAPWRTSTTAPLQTGCQNY